MHLLSEAFRKIGRGTERQLEPAGNAEFLEEVIAMRFDRLFADKESFGNLLVREAGTDKIENIDFLLGQMDIVLSVRVAAQDLAQGLMVDPQFTFVDFFDGLQELFAVGILGQNPSQALGNHRLDRVAAEIHPFIDE